MSSRKLPLEAKRLLSVQEVAALLGVSRQTVYNWLYLEGLPSIKVGRIRRIHPDSLNEWLKERETTNGNKAPRP